MKETPVTYSCFASLGTERFVLPLSYTPLTEISTLKQAIKIVPDSYPPSAGRFKFTAHVP